MSEGHCVRHVQDLPRVLAGIVALVIGEVQALKRRIAGHVWRLMLADVKRHQDDSEEPPAAA